MSAAHARVLLVTEQALLLLAFRELLDKAGLDAEHSVFGAADLAGGIGGLSVSMVVIDPEAGLTWEKLNGLRGELPNAKFVIWGRVTPQLVQQALAAGIEGVLSNRLAPAEAADALSRISRGERQFRFEAEWQRPKPSKPGSSAREQEVVALVMGGRTNRQIATELHTTEGSVKVYLNRVFGKTGVKSRHELALVGEGIARPGLPTHRRKLRFGMDVCRTIQFSRSLVSI
jgi:DNA-binding NarL/FixJ family response regulator